MIQLFQGMNSLATSQREQERRLHQLPGIIIKKDRQRRCSKLIASVMAPKYPIHRSTQAATVKNLKQDLTSC